MDLRGLVSLIFVAHSVVSEDVLFPSGLRFTSVDPSSATGGASLYADPKKTGSFLFDSSGNENKQLSMLVTIRDFKSPSSSYFRAHPGFISCLNYVRNEMQNDGTPLMWVSGYKTKTDVGSSTTIQDQYAQAGTGAVLKFRPTVTGDVKNIAKAALKYCPNLFEALHRDIGLILMADSVHIHMTGSDDLGPHFSADLESGASLTSNAFRNWALAAINTGIDPVKSPDCSAFSGIQPGSMYPRDVRSAEEAVGQVDTPITRDTPEDFSTLQQYLGTNIDFINPSPGASWCGKEGLACVDCTAAPVGNHASSRCAVRLMTSRMYNVLRLLQKMTRDAISGSKLRITKAFVEPYQGQTDYSATSLHVEGRQVTVELTVPSEQNLQKVSQLAECIGIDFMEHKGNHLVLAVQKMKGRSPMIQDFGESRLIAVAPPFAKRSVYALPSEFPDYEQDSYPLYYTSGQEQSVVASLITPDAAEKPTLGMFASKDADFKYIRLHPLIPKCYAQVVWHLNKNVQDGEPRTGVEIKRAFITTKEQEGTLDTADERYNTFNLGTGLELGLVSGKNPSGLTVLDLLQATLDKCAPVFAEANEQMGIGLYEDRVFVDIRTTFEMWTTDPTLIPEEYGDVNSRLQVYRKDMQERYEAAREERIVDPDDIELAQKSARVPHKQSNTYQYVPNQQDNDAGDSKDRCVPKTDTEFCKISKKHRDARISFIWEQVQRKYNYHNKDEVKNALEKCFGLCGTCLEGSVYEQKIKYCDEFIHWIPFGLMNENTVSALFPRDNLNVRKCARKYQTIEDAEVGLLVLSTVEATFRPDPAKSVEVELYSAADNPSPMMMLLHRLFAIHATGVVKVFVKDNTDISSLKEPLEVLMLYNKNVTRLEVFPMDTEASDTVAGDLNSMKLEMATNGYPSATRQYITPISVLPYPDCKDKRDSSFAIGDQLVEKHYNWESNWARQEL